jgi:N-methylhydantoinase B
VWEGSTGGGGGAPPPPPPDPALVLAEVRDGLLSPEAAKRDYGVTVPPP